MESMLISGIAKDTDIARVSVIGVPDEPGLAFKMFSKLATNDVNIDIILQSVGRDGTKDIAFTVSKDKLADTKKVIENFMPSLKAQKVIFDEDVAKVSIVGAGMESHSGFAAKMFESLYNADINIQMISTSEIKISVLIKAADADRAVSALHKGFFD